MRGISLLLFIFVSLFDPTPLFAMSKKTVYVWHFTTRDGARTDLTKSLTEEFEQALVKASCSQVQESRLYERLFRHAQGIFGLDQIESTDREALGGLAQLVIFGEVYQDTPSQQLRVGIKVEDLVAMSIVYQDSEADRIIKFSDGEARERLMASLAYKVCGALGVPVEPEGNLIDFTSYEQGDIVEAAGDCNVVLPGKTSPVATAASAGACTFTVSQGNGLEPPYAVELEVFAIKGSSYRLTLRERDGQELAFLSARLVEKMRPYRAIAEIEFGNYSTEVKGYQRKGTFRIVVRDGMARLFYDGKFLMLQPISGRALGSVTLSGVTREEVYVYRLGALPLAD